MNLIRQGIDSAILMGKEVWSFLPCPRSLANTPLAPPPDFALDGRTVVLTGCTSGIGLALIPRLGKARAARVFLCARDAERLAAAASQAKEAWPRTEWTEVALDLTDLRSVAAAAGTIQSASASVHSIIACAGVMMCPFGTTKQGFETQLGVNHLGHAALILRLAPAVPEGGRITLVTSAAHWMAHGITALDTPPTAGTFDTTLAYAESKLANAVFAFELQRKFAAAGRDIAVVAVHPGVVATNLTRHLPDLLQNVWGALAGWLVKTSADGARDVFAAVASTSLVSPTSPRAHQPGTIVCPVYSLTSTVAPPSRDVQDEALGTQLWDWTLKAAKLRVNASLTEVTDA